MLNDGTASAASFLHLSFDEYFSACLQYSQSIACRLKGGCRYSSVAQWQSIRLLTGGL